jgi:putative tricarboxylic transport membrane protein
MWHDLFLGFGSALEPLNFLSIVLGSVIGFAIGAFPALDTTVATALMVPLTFAFSPVQALLLLTAIYCNGSYAGGISAILFRIPGSGEAIMTTLDGYKFTERGKASEALGLHLTSSVIGGILGSITLIFATPLLTDFALRFGPAEYFALGVFGMTCISGLAGISIVRGLITGAIGMLLATVGIDPISGLPRFTFGSGALLGGIGFLPATIGLFAGAEVFRQVGREKPFSVTATEGNQLIEKQRIRIKLPSLMEFYRSNRKWLVLKSAIIGVLVGAMPAVGGTTAAVVSYGAAVRSSKHPQTFGTGEPEGVIAPEVANNACAPAAMIPMLSLGIPGSGNTAIILGAFLLHGLDAGPMFLVHQRELAFTLMAGVLIAQLVMFGIPFIGVIPFMKLRSLPGPFLAIFILSFALLGSVATGNPNALPQAVLMGIFGYFLERYRFPLGPIVFGMVLGPIIEKSLRRALVISQNDFLAVVSRPIALCLLLGAIFVALFPVIRQLLSNRKAS